MDLILKDNKMNLYHVCNNKALVHLHNTGYLCGYPEFACIEYIQSYDWMVEKMITYIGSRPEKTNVYPVWCWTDKEDAIRSGKKKKDFLITISIPKEKVLISSFEHWHNVLNNWYLSLTEKDNNKFEDLEKSVSKEEIQNKKEQSWELIFEHNFHRYNDYEWTGNPRMITTQACIWVLTKDMITSIERL